MTTKVAPRRGREKSKARRLQAPETATVPCAFCRGKGLDPFDIMSPLSICCVCGGSGAVVLKTPYGRCAFCQGTGVYPGSRQTCTACNGVGASPIPEPGRACPHCQGTGWEPHSETGFYCFSCHGTGMVENELSPSGNRG